MEHVNGGLGEMAARIDGRSAPAAKIALFRSLFRGRDDVHARRFENRKTGKSGYAPVCANEWVAGICNKPRVKCADCPHRAFLPLDDDAIRRHLTGAGADGRDYVAGVYPMLADESCRFLAIDFDGDAWRGDVAAVAETCRGLDLPHAVERSRSGRGAHLWLLFSEPLPATLARKLGSLLLTETMERRPEIGLASYDRLFPNQDTLPKGGFGNLIALPLQKGPREAGNSVFLDESLAPHPDPWAFLSSLRRIDRATVERIAGAAEARGRVMGVRFALADNDGEAAEPWNAPPSRAARPQPLEGPFPECVELVLGDQVYLAKDGLPPALRNRLMRLAAFQNPEFYRAQAMRLPTFQKPRVIACAEDLPAHIGLPRGCLDEVRDLLGGLGIATPLRDERVAGVPMDLRIAATLRDGQQAALDDLLAHDTGVLAATTAFGKTVVAIAAIAARGVNTLILVHRQQLMEQWVSRIAEFLGLAGDAIGRLGGGRRKLTGGIDVALIQSLVRKGVVDDRVADYGHLVVDECHHVSAAGFEAVVRRAKARFVLGLSATVARKDGHHPIIFMQCGPVRHRVDARGQAETRPFNHQVIVRPTGLRRSGEADPDARAEYQHLCGEIIDSAPRNAMIRDDVAAAIADGRSPLVLTERTGHVAVLEALLRPLARHLVVLQGGMARAALREALERLATIPGEETRIIIATGRFVGEGFDDARLDTLFLTMPVSWRGTIAQYAGRLHRLHEGKRVVRIHDYADLDVPMLARMFTKRCAGYEAVGYRILVPGSALPGWPPDIPLPADPGWKNDHAESIRRLVRDGVDSRLARDFREVACVPDADHPERSASEAFLFRRLESLDAATGLFRLNPKLPIPFDGWCEMEVDLFAPSLRIAIEIDGPQHLGDEAAYRRDRHKDALLQRHGCFVLRFLAADLATRLDAVLDEILAVIAHRRG